MKRAMVVLLIVLVGVVSAGSLVLATSTTPGSEADDASPQARGTVYTVLQGESGEGLRWAVRAYESDVGLCVDLDLVGEINSKGGGCGFNLVGESADGRELFGLGVLELKGRTFVYGPLVRDMGRTVSVEAGEASIGIATTSGPKDLRFDFYAQELPSDAKVTGATLRDGAGRPVASRTL